MKSGTFSVWWQTAQSNLLSLPDMIIHLDQSLLIEAINAEITVGMFQDNQVAIAGDGITAVDYLTRGCSNDCRSLRYTDFDSFIDILAMRPEPIQQFPFERPDKKSFGWLDGTA